MATLARETVELGDNTEQIYSCEWVFYITLGHLIHC